MSDTVSVVRISGTNGQGGHDQLVVEGTTVRDSVCWRGQSLYNELGYRVMPLISPHSPEELHRLIGEASSYLESQGWSDVMFETSGGQGMVMM